MPVVNPQALESVYDFMQRVAKMDIRQCPCCATGRLQLVELLQGSKTLPAPGAHDGIKPQSTGPP